MVDRSIGSSDDIVLIPRYRHRSAKRPSAVLKDITFYRVILVSGDQDVNTKSPADRLLITVPGAVAGPELKRERTKDGLVRVRAAGKSLGRLSLPYQEEGIAPQRTPRLSHCKISTRIGLRHQAVKQRSRRSKVRKRRRSGR